MPLKTYKICSKIFEHGFEPPPPLLNNLKKTAELVRGTRIPHPLSVDPGRGVRSRVDPQANGHVQLDLERSSYRFSRILDSWDLESRVIFVNLVQEPEVHFSPVI